MNGISKLNLDFSRSLCKSHKLPIKSLNLDSSSPKVLLCEKCLESEMFAKHISLKDCLSRETIDSMFEEAETMLKVKEYYESGQLPEAYFCIEHYFTSIDKQFDSVISKLVAYKVELKDRIVQIVSEASQLPTDFDIVSLRTRIEELMDILSTAEELKEEETTREFRDLLDKLNKRSISQGFKEKETLNREFNAICRDFSRRTDEFFKSLNSLYEIQVLLQYRHGY